MYGVRTNEDRWSAVQVIEVENTFIRLRYRAWERPIPSVEIVGSWQCESGVGGVVDPSSVTFELSPALATARSSVTAGVSVGAMSGTVGGTSAVIVGGPRSKGQRPSAEPPAPDPCAPLFASVRSLLPSGLVQRQALESLPLEDRRIGRWTGVVTTQASEIARFDAVTQGFGPGRKARWQINGHGVPDATGDMDVEGVSIHHQASGMKLVLGTEATKAFEFLLGVTVIDNDGNTATTSRCVRYEPECEQKVDYLPAFHVYQQAYLDNFGVVEVGTVTVSPGAGSETSVSTYSGSVEIT